MRFALVDVFTDCALSGNPLAVVPHATGLDDALMANLAREFNQSETTFLMAPSRAGAGADWRLRSFTPAGVEVFGVGHNALGAWWWLADTGRLDLSRPCTIFHQEVGSRVLPVMVDSEGGRPTSIAMTQAAPVFGAVVLERVILAAALGLCARDIGPAGFPAQVVSTGAPHLVVPVEAAALSRARPDAAALRAILQAHVGEGCYLFTLTPGDATLHAIARFFNPVAGITEDPATESAAGALACYLISHDVVQGHQVRIAQGAETGRPSRLEVQVDGGEVQLVGRAVVVAEGAFRSLTTRPSRRGALV